MKDVIPENTLSEETENELNKSKEIENTVNRENLVDRRNSYTQFFKCSNNRHFWQIRFNGKITLKI